jgi:hypothetical protein
MTTCAECLAALASTRLSDIRHDTLILDHCSTCERCATVAADVRYAEERLAMTLSDLRPGVPSITLAGEAISGAERLRRRSAAKWFRRALAAFGGVILATYIAENRGAREPQMTETIPVRCITTEAAVDILTPYLRSNGSVVYTTRGMQLITVRGTSEEIATAKAQLDALEARECRIPGADVIPSAGKPGKD